MLWKRVVWVKLKFSTKKKELNMQTTRTRDCIVRNPVVYVALELSLDTWKLAVTDGLGRPPRVREVEAGRIWRLDTEIRVAKRLFGLPADTPVVACYEAGRDGFWIHRRLTALGWTNHVIDPASIEVSRKKRRPKTDRLDARRMVMALIRFHLGDRHACRAVTVPSHEDEDSRQLQRELDELTAERTSHISRIKALLFLHGARLKEIDKNFPEWLAAVRTGDGQPFPPQLRQRLLREFERLQVVVRQMRELEQQRATLYRQASREVGSLPRWQHLANYLRQLNGIGEAAAMTLATELFAWRDLQNRRQVAALAGLTPSAYQSGSSVDQEQGISKAGRGALRKLLVEIAWGWINFQLDSELTQWFMKRFGNGNSRQRRIGIVALARKLLVALWKYVHGGEIPRGAKFSKHLNHFRYTKALE
jgi:transposase